MLLRGLLLVPRLRLQRHRRVLHVVLDGGRALLPWYWKRHSLLLDDTLFRRMPRRAPTLHDRAVHGNWRVSGGDWQRDRVLLHGNMLVHLNGVYGNMLVHHDGVHSDIQRRGVLRPRGVQRLHCAGLQVRARAFAAFAVNPVATSCCVRV
jgi:hypothetical protein